MDCPVCKRKSQIIDTRLSDYGVRRRHIYRSCGHRFTTVEIPMESYRFLADELKNSKKTGEKIEQFYKEFTKMYEHFCL